MSVWAWVTVLLAWGLVALVLGVLLGRFLARRQLPDGVASSRDRGRDSADSGASDDASRRAS